MSKEYKRLYQNERRAWKAFEKVTEAFENSEEFKKALARWKKRDKELINIMKSETK